MAFPVDASDIGLCAQSEGRSLSIKMTAVLTSPSILHAFGRLLITNGRAESNIQTASSKEYEAATLLQSCQHFHLLDPNSTTIDTRLNQTWQTFCTKFACTQSGLKCMRKRAKGRLHHFSRKSISPSLQNLIISLLSEARTTAGLSQPNLAKWQRPLMNMSPF